MKSIVPSSYAISMCSDSKMDWCFACALPHALLLSSGDLLRQYRVGCGDATVPDIRTLTTQYSVLGPGHGRPHKCGQNFGRPQLYLFRSPYFHPLSLLTAFKMNRSNRGCSAGYKVWQLTVNCSLICTSVRLVDWASVKARMNPLELQGGTSESLDT